MDKNTMYGMLLMGAVLLGFMWHTVVKLSPLSL